MGDLREMINRLDYLNDGDINSGNDLGVQGIWLSTIFQSPSYHKYDVQDYYSIDSRFGTMEDLRELPGVAFQLDIPQIMPVMSALVFSVLVGLAAVWTKAKTIIAVLDEFQNIVLSVVKKVVIPESCVKIDSSFEDIPALEQVWILGDTDLGHSPFWGCDNVK